MSSGTAQANSDERAGLVGFATLLRADGVIQPQDLVPCQKPIYLPKYLAWTAHKPKLELFSRISSRFSVGMASRHSPGFPAEYPAGHRLPLPTAERWARAPLPREQFHALHNRPLCRRQKQSVPSAANAAPRPRAAGQPEVAPS